MTSTTRSATGFTEATGDSGVGHGIAIGTDGGALGATVGPRGAHIASLVHEPSGTELLYRRDPAALPEAAASPTGSNAAWHAAYPGGWHGLLPHSGDERIVNGVAHPFHGEAAWSDWSVAATAADSVRLRLRLDTVPLDLEREISVAGDRLTVTQHITSRSAGDTPISWAEHPAFGAPLIGPATQVAINGAPLPLVFPAPGARHGAFGTHAVGRDAEAVISNPELGLTVTMRWDGALFPHAFVWQEHRASDGFPWWGEADVMAIEPSVRPYYPETAALGPLVVPAGGRISSSITIDVAGQPGGERTAASTHGGKP